jgi:hypothetical protein
MNRRAKRLLITAAIALYGIGSGTGAYAARSTDPVASVPATRVVSCNSSAVWLALSSSLGMSCYTGNGSRPVNLPGVSRIRVAGVHRVCLVNGSGFRCIVGPGALIILPPTFVQAISISTPSG